MYTYLNTRNEVKEKHLNYKAPLFTTSTIGTHSNKSQRSMNLELNVFKEFFQSFNLHFYMCVCKHQNFTCHCFCDVSLAVGM